MSRGKLGDGLTLSRTERSTVSDPRWPVLVNCLPLPHDLIVLIEERRWRCPTDHNGLDRLFPERSEFCCYSPAGMAGETAVLYRYDTPMWRGRPDPDNPPGDIDPTLAVLIADLGIGHDQPIALDYRLSVHQPCVLTLHWGHHEWNRWIEIAPSFKTFTEMIGL